jgi:hypothetical protein
LYFSFGNKGINKAKYNIFIFFILFNWGIVFTLNNYLYFMQQILSDFIDLIFGSNDPANEQLHSWWVIFGVLLFLVFIVFVLPVSGT